ncbi:MAG: sensor histidine kinase, partial [Pseudomonadota bacterium]
KAHHELEKRVQERTEALRRLSFKLLDAQEEERRRIALELHDSIGQSLSAIKYRIETSVQEMGRENPSKCDEFLHPIIPIVQQTVEEIRRIQKNLRPSILDDLGLLATVSWFCRDFETTYSGIRVEKKTQLKENDVPDSLKIIIFRVLQESLNNIAKHSRAGHVELSLKKTDGKIELVISDNGIGIDNGLKKSGKGKEGGLGLTSMRERTELSGGSFSIRQKKGKGTTVQASWPT